MGHATSFDSLYDTILPITEALQSLVKVPRPGRDPGLAATPSASSAAMAELAQERSFGGAWGFEPASAVHALIGMKLALAEDEIRCLCRLFKREEDPPAFGDKVLTRAAIENLGRVWWIADPATGTDPAARTRLRIARGWTEQLYNLSELSRLPPGMLSGDPRAEEAVIVSAATAHGFQVLPVNGRKALDHDRPSGRFAFGQALGRGESGAWATELIDSQWAYLSAVTHGTTYAIHVNVADAGTDAGGERRGRLLIKPEQITLTLADVAIAYMRATRRYLELTGWEPSGRATAADALVAALTAAGVGSGV